MLDEVYTAQRVEYSNGAFVGLTEECTAAKTVLTFMIQSALGRYKDVVSLIPVNRLDTKLLQFWLMKVLKALHDIVSLSLYPVIIMCVTGQSFKYNI